MRPLWEPRRHRPAADGLGRRGAGGFGERSAIAMPGKGIDDCRTASMHSTQQPARIPTNTTRKKPELSESVTRCTGPGRCSPKPPGGSGANVSREAGRLGLATLGTVAESVSFLHDNLSHWAMLRGTLAIGRAPRFPSPRDRRKVRGTTGVPLGGYSGGGRAADDRLHGRKRVVMSGKVLAKFHPAIRGWSLGVLRAGFLLLLRELPPGVIACDDEERPRRTLHMGERDAPPWRIHRDSCRGPGGAGRGVPVRPCSR